MSPNKIQVLMWGYNHLGLIITIFFEWLVYVAFIRKKIPQLLLWSFVINGVTQPVLNYLYHNTAISIYSLEIGAVIIETVAIKYLLKQNILKSFLISLSANIVSYGLGIVIYLYLLPFLF